MSYLKHVEFSSVASMFDHLVRYPLTIPDVILGNPLGAVKGWCSTTLSPFATVGKVSRVDGKEVFIFPLAGVTKESIEVVVDGKEVAVSWKDGDQSVKETFSSSFQEPVFDGMTFDLNMLKVTIKENPKPETVKHRF